MSFNEKQLKNLEIIDVISENQSQIVFKGLMKHNSKLVVIKLEKGDNLQLYKEFLILNQLCSVRGISQPLSFGKAGEKFYFVTEFFEKPLSQIIENKILSLETILHIGTSILKILEVIHSQNIIYGNLCPENIVLQKYGTTNQYQINLIGFGEARYVYDTPSQKRFSKSLQYQSCTYHKNGLVSKIDELESLGFLLVKLRLGSLRWKSMIEAHMLREKREFLAAKSAQKGMPQEFKAYFRQIKEFREKPYYYVLQEVLASILNSKCDVQQSSLNDLDQIDNTSEPKINASMPLIKQIHESSQTLQKYQKLSFEQIDSDSETESLVDETQTDKRTLIKGKIILKD